jgi:hypothetical protein
VRLRREKTRTYHRSTATTIAAALLLGLAACDTPEMPAPPTDAPVAREGQPPAATVESSGKAETELVDLPPLVVATALVFRPGLTIVEAEYETRDGREYYDVAGLMPDDTEVELDMTRIDGEWTVVEIQRDIPSSELPPAVAEAFANAVPEFNASRIIESDQVDGTVIYEFFGPGDPPVKHEIRWADGSAELLEEEWAH